MKRLRPSETMFSPSDSDSDTAVKSTKRSDASYPPVHPNPHSKDEKTNVIGSPSPHQPDTLEEYMSSLQPPAANSKFIRVSKHLSTGSTSSDEEFTPLFIAPSESIAQVPNPNDNQKQLTLSAVDYSSQSLPLVNRVTFTPPAHIETNPRRIAVQMASLHATIRNGCAPVLSSFSDTSPPTPRKLSEALSTNFPTLTPIQAVSLSHILSGRDVVAIAQTGSGKTIAYALPLLTHAVAQKGSSRGGNGPIGLVLSPTRELAIQISDVLNEYGKCISISACCVVGGVPKYEQYKQIRDSGAAIIVCTPGRLIDMLRMRACRMSRCSFVVMDEADRMLDLGFGPQVLTLLSQIRPDAQRTLFSATMPKFVQRLVADVLKDPVQILLTGANYQKIPMVASSVTDCFLNFENDSIRKEWLMEHLPNFVREGLLIIFCSTRGDSAGLANTIRARGTPVACIHGETEQSDREDFLRMFRANELPILVTTDVAARGLDIDDVRNVINYGCAKSWEWHVHRCGRTGRASRKGNAYTLMDQSNQNDISFANEAANILRREKRDIPKALAYLQELSGNSNRESQKRNKAKRQKR